MRQAFQTERNLQPAMTVMICVQYQVNGQEYWDNNFGKNYLINLIPKRSLPTNESFHRQHPPRGYHHFTFPIHRNANNLTSILCLSPFSDPRGS